MGAGALVAADQALPATARAAAIAIKFLIINA